MKKWDYAALSHMVKTHGGPVKYSKTIADAAVRETNKKWLCGVIPTAIVLIPFAAKGIYDIAKEHQEQKRVSQPSDSEAEDKSC